MEQILELAEKLGNQVAADPRGQNFAKARAAFEASLEARQIVGDYERQQHKLAELEMSGKPIEPEDKRRLASLHQSVTAHPVLKNLMKAQADYLQLMTLISERIERAALGLSGAAEPEGGQG